MKYSNILYRLLKNTQISNFMKILLMETELFHADFRTDTHHEADSGFSQFCE